MAVTAAVPRNVLTNGLGRWRRTMYNVSQYDRMHQITVYLLGWGEQRKSDLFPSASALCPNARMTTTSLLSARMALHFASTLPILTHSLTHALSHRKQFLGVCFSFTHTSLCG
ncbi:hypothetical protein V8E52_011002 [Russula decolorans]|jgi:hypothetical protein